MAIHQDDHKEVLIMGKGVGFGRKVAERIEVRPEDRLYSLQKYKERGGAKEIVKSIAPEFLEVTNAVLDEAEKIFGKIDRMVLFPLADHIAFAVKRIQNHEQISNPLTEDIRVLFHMEFKAASCLRRYTMIFILNALLRDSFLKISHKSFLKKCVLCQMLSSERRMLLYLENI